MKAKLHRFVVIYIHLIVINPKPNNPKYLTPSPSFLSRLHLPHFSQTLTPPFHLIKSPPLHLLLAFQSSSLSLIPIV
jgi:hypothetical protein